MINVSPGLKSKKEDFLQGYNIAKLKLSLNDQLTSKILSLFQSRLTQNPTCNKILSYTKV